MIDTFTPICACPAKHPVSCMLPGAAALWTVQEIRQTSVSWTGQCWKNNTAAHAQR